MSIRRGRSAPRSVLCRSVDARWLYNNFSVGIVLLDVREATQFQANTLRTALNVPPPPRKAPPVTSMAQLERRLASLTVRQFSTTRRALSHVVVFGEGETTTIKEQDKSWEQQLIELLVTEGIVGCVSVLQGGFPVVRDRYYFYTTKYQPVMLNPDGSSNKTGARVTYPNEVLDGFLYLGNMWQAQSWQVMQELGITHVVNASLDIGDVWKKHGIMYCDVQVRDDANADIARFFDGVFAFIEQARLLHEAGRPHRVLVHCTQGISRSATLVIMYLMRARQWSLVTAFNATRESRPVIVPNDGFFRALLAEERRLFRNRNSVQECGLDELLTGALPDCPEPSLRHPDLDLELELHPARSGDPEETLSRQWNPKTQAAPDADPDLLTVCGDKCDVM